jgi:hypothetical protein
MVPAREPEGFPHRSPAARHQDQHLADRFRPDQRSAADALQGLFGDVISGDVGG